MKEDRNMVETWGTKPDYDTCKTSDIPNYFHDIELPYRNCRGSRMNEHTVSHKPDNNTDQCLKQHNELTSSKNNLPFGDRINIWYRLLLRNLEMEYSFVRQFCSLSISQPQIKKCFKMKGIYWYISKRIYRLEAWRNMEWFKRHVICHYVFNDIRILYKHWVR